MGWEVDIDVEKCTGDEECVNICPVGVIEMQDDKAVAVNLDECLGCESCVEACPSGAIVVTETWTDYCARIKSAGLISDRRFFMKLAEGAGCRRPWRHRWMAAWGHSRLMRGRNQKTIACQSEAPKRISLLKLPGFFTNLSSVQNDMNIHGFLTVTSYGNLQTGPNPEWSNRAPGAPVGDRAGAGPGQDHLPPVHLL
jgi:Fe-S-cluster-containing hydrogenase component 2